jgi:C4-dicarboxylate transporter, DctM subunit
MGELLLRSGIATEMYRALNRWLSWLPGGLMHTNIASAALFAATSGSSIATAATIGKLSIPNIRRSSYNERLFLGTLAAGGTLGILIPPSLNLILYGVLAETSVSRLYLAALIPGILLAVHFMGAVLVLCLLRPAWGGIKQPFVWSAQLVRELFFLLPPLTLFLLVVGTIYAGIATPTEAAAFGVVGSFLFAWWRGAITVETMLQAFAGTMRTTCMMVLIVVAAFVLNFVMVSIGLTDTVTRLVLDLNWTPLATLVAIIIFYVLLGCFMETVTMMVATTPIIVPVIISLGYDPVWFGVLFIILIELAMITPPIGINLFVIQGVRGTGPISDVIIGSVPFVFMMFSMIALLIAFPSLALWLPQTAMN